MAIISVQANPSTAKLVSVNSSLTLAVSATGSDTATIYRPSKLEGGDYSSLPFATPQGAIDAVPKFIPPGSSVAIQLTNTAYASTIIDGFYGGGTLYILGGNVTSTLVSGNASGTAGTGTTATGLVRPNASAAWTANDLRGKIVKFNVAGTTHWRAIENNTLTVAQVQSVSNLSSTSTYQVINPQTSFTKNATTGNCLTVRNCEVEVVLESILINDTLVNYGIYLDNCKKVTMRGLSLVSDAAMTLYAKDCFNISFKDSFLGSAANASIDGSFIADASRLVTDNGMVELINIHKTTVGSDSLNCSGNAIRLINCVYVNAYLNANSGSATPLYLENVLDFQHSGLTGGNVSTSYGIEFTRGGHYAIAGASLTGNSANQLLIEGSELSYSTISGAFGGSAFKRGTSVEWGNGYTMSLDRWNIPQSAGAGDQLITYDLVIGGGFKSYGLSYVLDPAYREITATTSATQGNAVVCGWQRTNIVAATTSAGVRFIGNSDIAPSNLAGGMAGLIKNSTTTAVNLYPPTGLSIVVQNSNLGANNPYSLAPGLTAEYLIDNNTNYNIAVVDASVTGGGGGGDVVGPAAATNNALPRFDLTTGKLIKNSTALLDDSGNFTGIGTINTFSLTTFSNNIAAISTTVTSLSTTLISLSTSVAAISTTVTSLSTSFNTLNSTVTSLSTSFNTLNSTVISLSTTVVSLSTNVSNIAVTVTSLSTSFNTLNATVVSLSTSLNSTNATAVSLSSTVSSISTNFNTLNSTVISLSTNVSGISTTVTSLSTSFNTLNANVISLSTTVVSLSTSLNATNATAVSLSTTVVSLSTAFNTPFANSKLAQMNPHTYKGNNTATTQTPLDVTATQLTADLNAMVGDSGSGGTKGLVPAPAAGDAAASKFLKADGTWATATGSGSVASDAIWTAKGDLAVALANASATKLSVSTTNGYVLTSDSTQNTGIKWAPASGGGAVATDAIWKAAGDLAVATGNASATNLTLGGAGMLLRATSVTQATWQQGLMYDMNHFELWDDWIGATNTSTLNWTNVNSSGGVTTNSTTGLDKDHQGDAVFNTNAGATNRCALYLGGGGMTVGTSPTGTEMTWVTYLDQLSTAGQRFALFAGHGTTASTSVQTSAIGFRHVDNENNGQYVAYCKNSGTETTVNTSITPTVGGWDRLKWVLNPAATSVTFYVNNVVAGAISTNIPNGQQMSPTIGLFKSVGATGVIMRLDAFHYYVRLARD